MKLDEMYPSALRTAIEKACPGIPQPLREGLLSFLVHRTAPGSFLLKVLKGDLFGAAVRGDPVARTFIVPIALFLWNEIPHEILGDDGVRFWIDSRPYEFVPLKDPVST